MRGRRLRRDGGEELVVSSLPLPPSRGEGRRRANLRSAGCHPMHQAGIPPLSGRDSPAGLQVARGHPELTALDSTSDLSSRCLLVSVRPPSSPGSVLRPRGRPRLLFSPTPDVRLIQKACCFYLHNGSRVWPLFIPTGPPPAPLPSSLTWTVSTATFLSPGCHLAPRVCHPHRRQRDPVKTHHAAGLLLQSTPGSHLIGVKARALTVALAHRARACPLLVPLPRVQPFTDSAAATPASSPTWRLTGTF